MISFFRIAIPRRSGTHSSACRREFLLREGTHSTKRIKRERPLAARVRLEDTLHMVGVPR